MEERAEIYWNEFIYCYKYKFLREHKFWGGFKHFKYKYLPNELKQIIMLEIEHK